MQQDLEDKMAGGADGVATSDGYGPIGHRHPSNDRRGRPADVAGPEA